MWWKTTLYYALCALIFASVFAFSNRKQKPNVQVQAPAKAKVPLAIPNDGRWELLRVSLPQWLREKSPPEIRDEVEKLIHDLDAAEITFRNQRVLIGLWSYAPMNSRLQIIRSATRAGPFGFGFDEVVYSEGKWSCGNFYPINPGYPSRSTQVSR
jgi:hypothetical protein